MNTPRWTLQDRIRKAREHADFNQAQLAEKMGVSKNSVNRWETGDRNPSPKSLEALAEVTGIAPDWLINGEDLTQQNNTPRRFTIEVDADGARIINN